METEFDKITVTEERVVDVDSVLKYLKGKSKIGNPGMRGDDVVVDKRMLKDAALIIENFLDKLKNLSEKKNENTSISIKEQEEFFKQKAKITVLSFNNEKLTASINFLQKEILRLRKENNLLRLKDEMLDKENKYALEKLKNVGTELIGYRVDFLFDINDFNNKPENIQDDDCK